MWGAAGTIAPLALLLRAWLQHPVASRVCGRACGVQAKRGAQAKCGAQTAHGAQAAVLAAHGARAAVLALTRAAPSRIFSCAGLSRSQECREFKNGRCSRGDACRFSHIGGPATGGGSELEDRGIEAEDVRDSPEQPSLALSAQPCSHP